MKSVYKYEFPFPLRDGLTIPLPDGFRVIFADCQPAMMGDAHPTAWIELDPSDVRVSPQFFVAYPTGAEIPETMIWQASCRDREGGYVWHIYRRA